MLIAIDDYNALYDYSAFEYRNRPYVFIILPNSFQPFIFIYLHLSSFIHLFVVFMLANSTWLRYSVVLMKPITLLLKISLMNLLVFTLLAILLVKSQPIRFVEMVECAIIRIR